MVLGAHDLPSSPITVQPIKAPIKIQSLSLLVGSGSDRQQEHQLFQFHIQGTMFPWPQG